MKLQILKCEDDAALYVDGQKVLQCDWHWEIADTICAMIVEDLLAEEAELEVLDFLDNVSENDLSYKDEWERVWVNGEGFVSEWPY